MCLNVVGGNNYIFMSFTSEKWLILSRILAIFLDFCEILNICDKNETYCFFNVGLDDFEKHKKFTKLPEFVACNLKCDLLVLQRLVKCSVINNDRLLK